MNTGIPCAIFDIDGTLADAAWRVDRLHHDDYSKNSDEKWAAFFAGIPYDEPIWPVVRVLKSMSACGHRIVLCTGRSETNRAATEAWMERHGIWYDALYMRPSDCFRNDDIVKSELLDKILADGWSPMIVFEDRQRVVDMWRARGLQCLQVAKGDY